ncbi:MAG: hypothetical protein HPY78_01390 [Brevinematales bacterium]|nr:hypothetical protein [Brevinematales bacterium]
MSDPGLPRHLLWLGHRQENGTFSHQPAWLQPPSGLLSPCTVAEAGMGYGDVSATGNRMGIEEPGAITIFQQNNR